MTNAQPPTTRIANHFTVSRVLTELHLCDVDAADAGMGDPVLAGVILGDGVHLAAQVARGPRQVAVERPGSPRRHKLAVDALQLLEPDLVRRRGESLVRQGARPEGRRDALTAETLC